MADSIKVGAVSSSNLNRNVYIGTGLGLVASTLLLSRGKLKTIPKMKYGIKEVMTLCAGSSFGGYMGANLTTQDNFKGRTIEIKNQLLYNDLIPLTLLKGLDLLYKAKNKLKRSIVLSVGLLAATYLGHHISEKVNKKKYPVKACHLIADFDDFLLPIAIATKSKGLQQFLKIISPITFAPIGVNVGKSTDSRYA